MSTVLSWVYIVVWPLADVRVFSQVQMINYIQMKQHYDCARVHLFVSPRLRLHS